uniref:Methyltransferase n=1 Tax=Coccidioides posadasii RMSCC 3488 TaxID=454284 RepID=A0A0J6FB65_COCPO|nr:methyltransferase [Coccidioides posadasii RMSCC 3488]
MAQEPAATTSSPREPPEASPQQPAIVPADDHDLYDGDSDAASFESSTASLTSSILGHKMEDDTTPTEKDHMSLEQDRLDLHHHIYNMILGGELYRAPIPPGTSKILDLGTGTGSWAIDVADKLPEAVVTGFQQIANLKLMTLRQPGNFRDPVRFHPCPEPSKAAPKIISVYSAKPRITFDPEGWFEVADATVGVFGDDDTINKAPNILEWRDHLIDASAKFGKPMGVSKNYKQWFIDTGFENVTEEIYKVPFSPWAKDKKLKELGRYQQAMMLEALEAYSLALFTKVLNWDVNRIQLLLVGVRKELMDRSLHIYSQYYIVYGQRPQNS